MVTVRVKLLHSVCIVRPTAAQYVDTGPTYACMFLHAYIHMIRNSYLKWPNVPKNC